MSPASPRNRWCVLRALAPLLLAPFLMAGDPPPKPAPAPIAWDPHKTWAFLVGLVTWKDKEVYEPFDDVKHRLEPVIDELLKKRGVPENQIVFLKDEEATKARIQLTFIEMLKKTRPGDFLFFYFQGHGYFTLKTGVHYFACYDAGEKDESGWSVPWIFDTIEREFQGNAAFMTADCCTSGGIVAEAKKRKGRISFGCLSSASGHNSSSGAWTYSRCLVKGLRGDPDLDLDGDGVVELDELGKYTQAKMAFVEEQMSLFHTTGDFDPRMALERATGKHDPAIGRHVMAKWDDGKVYKGEVIGDKEGKLRVRFLDDDTVRWVNAGDVHDFKPKEFVQGSIVLAFTEDEEDQKKKKWYPATVERVFMGMHLLKYEGKPDFWTEWAPASRIKAR